MFAKLSLLALAVPLVSALQLATPTNPTSGGQVTIHWTNQQGDPTSWSFELTNTAFNNEFAIANNVDPSASQLTLTLPIVPVGDGYTLQAVNIGNVSDIFAQTPDFAVGATTTSLTTSASTLSSAGSSSSGTLSHVTSITPSSTPGFSSNIITSSPSSSTSGASATTSTGAAVTSSSAAALSSRMGFGNSAGGIVAVVLSAVAGAAMIAL
ncbi:hypothetical protein BDZ97DRAFT_1901537 [Flammula alnicola]|nr:hypothetical protein BDZ97DRAFT_1901537 [Flammula alnicola]